MKLLSCSIPFLLLLCSFALSEPCLEEGASRTVIRSLDMESVGMPAGAEISSAEALEMDWGATEDMGSAVVVDFNTVSVEVSNKGGFITGPNGENVSGSGDTIEVNFSMTIRYLATVTKKTKGLDGSETTVEHQEWQERVTEFRDDTQVTPC